tara:strand:- start:774 stop:1538 length:765 start_codon:yes stop_codon:yes gene_type:complete
MNFENSYNHYLNHLQEKATLNIEPTHRCILQCVFCSRTREYGLKKIKDWRKSYGDLKPSDAKLIGKYFKRVTFCGSISDVIYHPNLIEVVDSLIHPETVYIEFRTNGSGKKIEWWKELVDVLNAYEHLGKRFIFGIDGIDQRCSINRVNQDFESAYEAMDYVAGNLISKSQNSTTWQYIPFGYNEKDIPKAFEMAQKLNVSFMILKSPRFGGNPKRKKISPPTNPNLISPSGFNEETVIKNDFELRRFLHANKN